MTYSEAADRWNKYQVDILNRSLGTVENYTCDVNNFFSKIGKNNVEDVTCFDAENYFCELSRQGLAETTRAKKVSVLKTFYNFLLAKDIVKKSPMEDLEKPKIPQKKVIAMNEREAHSLIETAKKRSVCKKDYFRNITIVSLLLSTGLRRNEAVNVKIDDVDLQKNSIIVRVGKGNKQRVVYYNENAKAILNEYICSHRKKYETAKTSEYLFVTQKSEKMCVTTLNAVVNSLLVESGLKEKGFTLHSLRKCFATTVYSNTKDLAVVQLLLGHSNPQTTMHYVGVNENSKKMAAQMVNF